MNEIGTSSQIQRGFQRYRERASCIVSEGVPYSVSQHVNFIDRFFSREVGEFVVYSSGAVHDLLRMALHPYGTPDRTQSRVVRR